jgi:hypothetical protein
VRETAYLRIYLLRVRRKALRSRKRFSDFLSISSNPVQHTTTSNIREGMLVAHLECPVFIAHDLSGCVFSSLLRGRDE